MKSLQVLYEDNHLLVINKCPGVATMGTQTEEPSVVRQAAEYVKQKYNKPGSAFIGVVSRLDRLVSGVLVLARTSKAASRLSAQIRERTTQKRYLALVSGGFETHTEDGWMTLCDWVAKDEKRQRMHIVPERTAGASDAKLRVRKLAGNDKFSVLEVDLITGRKHQIRLQLSSAGHPILGDRKYDSRFPFPDGIGLHCIQLRMLHPTRKEPMCFTATPGAAWHLFGRNGGQGSRGLVESALRQLNLGQLNVDSSES